MILHIALMEVDGEFIKSVGFRIRKLRRQQGLSIEKLAYKMDISYSQIARIETGKINPTIQTLKNLADGLGIEVYLFFIPDDEIQ